MNGLGQTDSTKQVKLEKIKVQLDSDIIYTVYIYIQLYTCVNDNE